MTTQWSPLRGMLLRHVVRTISAQTSSRFASLAKHVAWANVSYLADKFMCRISASLSSSRDKTSRNCMYPQHLPFDPRVAERDPGRVRRSLLSSTGQAVDAWASMRTEVTVVDS